jgi:predicted outer membrane repeat protein
VQDDDGDGLFSAEEQHYRTDAVGAGDSDRDGLSDAFEVRTGWTVSVTNRSPYHVSSDPAQADQDGDGLNDAQERDSGTDPTKPDTDDDGIADRFDPFPLFPAKVLRVKAEALAGGDGSSWATALNDLQVALSRASNGVSTASTPSDDVAEIWVAAGVYKPTANTNATDRTNSFWLVNNTSLYGGFSGFETKLSQRVADPLLNGTILSGDLMGNDTSTPWDNPATYNDNSHAVCSAWTDVGPGTIVDGFTITGGNCTGYGGGMFCRGRAQLRNLFFRANYGLNGAGLYLWLQGAGEPCAISDCIFLQNGATSAGGMLYLGPPDQQLVILTNCQFYENASTVTGDPGGAGLVLRGLCQLENCTFGWNISSNWGGGISILRPSTVRISRCEFFENTARMGGAGLYMTDFAGSGDLKVEVLQSLFWGNSTTNLGGAIAATTGSQSKRLYVLNSAIVGNASHSTNGAIHLGTNAAAWVENSILWGNTNKGVYLSTGASAVVRTSCLPDAGSYPGAGNINADPKLVDSFGGNLRLAPGSPCIDRGNNYIDYWPTVPGFQLLPDTDMDGNWRIVDGNSDGIKTVDMGAYERQGQ